MMDKKRVAVYGTLKRGFGNHPVMQRAVGEYVDSGRTSNPYHMVSLGGFPAIDLLEPTHRVYVEVYDVEDIMPLDRLEGYPHFYDRKVVEVELSDGTEVEAWVYHISPSRHSGGTVENGEWT